MRIRLPNGEERELDKDIDMSEKKKICEELIVEFDDDISSSWNTHPVRYFLNGLSNYLCWDKSEFYRDKEKGILSDSREKQMERVRYHGRWRRDTIFTELSVGDQLTIFGEMKNDDY